MTESDAGSRIAEVRVHSYHLTYAHGTYVMSQGREISTLASVVVSATTRAVSPGTPRYARSALLTSPVMPAA